MSAIIQSGKGDVFGPNGGVADGDLAIYNGTSGKFLKNSPLGSVVIDAMPVGSIVQTAYNDNGTWVSGSALIPADDTPPQWTEGTLFAALTTTITPMYANSLILGRIIGQASCTVVTTSAFAIFRGTGPSAIAATVVTPSVNFCFPVCISFYDLPGVTTAVQYNFRFGPNAAATVYINGNTSNRLLAGLNRTSLFLQEIKQ